jgi:hypothetical protein
MVRVFAVSFLSLAAIVGGFFADALAQEMALFEDFEDGAADGFAEVGGTWEIVEGRYVQSTIDPPGPYRSWVDAGELLEYAVEVDCATVAGEETKIVYAHADSSEDYRVDIWLNECRLTMPAWGEPWDSRTFVTDGLGLSYDQPFHVAIEVRRARTIR